MTSTSERAVVFIRLPGLEYVPAGGRRHAHREYFFRYGRRYLGRPDAIPLDPARMPLADMEFSGRALFSALRDAAPDRWGRKVLGLMAGRAPGTLSEFEVLTAAHHPQRMGALAFGPTPDGPASLAPWATGDAFCMVPEDLGRVAAIVARVDEVEDDEERDAVRSGMPEDAFLAALASSLSLGGARPKAMVSVDGTPWIAKFSKRGDPWREPVVEHATMTLAARCGITVASPRLMELDGHFVLLHGDGGRGRRRLGQLSEPGRTGPQARRRGLRPGDIPPHGFQRPVFEPGRPPAQPRLFRLAQNHRHDPGLRPGALRHPLQAMEPVPALRTGRPRGHTI
jgi:serine/threonine-protein kinase HipA